MRGERWWWRWGADGGKGRTSEARSRVGAFEARGADDARDIQARDRRGHGRPSGQRWPAGRTRRVRRADIAAPTHHAVAAARRPSLRRVFARARHRGRSRVAPRDAPLGQRNAREGTVDFGFGSRVSDRMCAWLVSKPGWASKRSMKPVDRDRAAIVRVAYILNKSYLETTPAPTPRGRSLRIPSLFARLPTTPRPRRRPPLSSRTTSTPA